MFFFLDKVKKVSEKAVQRFYYFVPQYSFQKLWHFLIVAFMFSIEIIIDIPIFLTSYGIIFTEYTQRCAMEIQWKLLVLLCNT